MITTKVTLKDLKEIESNVELPEDLSYGGFGYEQDFEKFDINDINICRKWIKENCTPALRINSDAGSSYYFKHVIERANNNYVSNGTCIVAFLLEGYRYKLTDFGSPNCWFNVKKPKRRW